MEFGMEYGVMECPAEASTCFFLTRETCDTGSFGGPANLYQR